MEQLPDIEPDPLTLPLLLALPPVELDEPLSTSLPALKLADRPRPRFSTAAAEERPMRAVTARMEMNFIVVVVGDREGMDWFVGF